MLHKGFIVNIPTWHNKLAVFSSSTVCFCFVVTGYNSQLAKHQWWIQREPSFVCALEEVFPAFSFAKPLCHMSSIILSTPQCFGPVQPRPTEERNTDKAAGCFQNVTNFQPILCLSLCPWPPFWVDFWILNGCIKPQMDASWYSVPVELKNASS